MSELKDNVNKRKELLKHMILQLHKGVAPEDVKKTLKRLLGQIPYEEVVEVEQELISEGLPQEEVLKLCDVHSEVLKGSIDQTGAKIAEPGHPVHTLKKENEAIKWEVESLEKIFAETDAVKDGEEAKEAYTKIKSHFISLMDVEKHYSRKENLLFPFLEKYGVTGPSSVMWGKHDEIRGMLKGVFKTLDKTDTASKEALPSEIETVFKPCAQAIGEMIFKEEQVLLPMAMDKLSVDEWYEIYAQSNEIGYCLYDPTTEWEPKDVKLKKKFEQDAEKIRLPSGSMTPEELGIILNTIPFDMTFVDKDDTVRYFTQGKDRIFARTRAILGRKVQLCHPPSSAHIVEKILQDFKSGKEDSAAFWLTVGGKFIHIEYFALRNKEGDYLGTLEVSQDLTEKRKLTGESRILDYGKRKS
jgi:DUF438 domain-containing protein